MQAKKGTIELRLAVSPADRAEFLQFPYRLYKNEPLWIAPLMMEQKKLIDTQKNPFYDDAEIALFLASRDGETVGRIAAIDNRAFNNFQKTNTGFFGFFDVINDQQVADTLVKAATDWLTAKGRQDILGPASPGMLDVIGVLIDGFEHEPGLLMPYNFPYYDTLLQNTGLGKAEDLLAYRVNQDTVTLDRMKRAADIVHARIPGLVIRDVDFKNLKNDVVVIREIFNEAWSKNWGFVPMTERQFDYLANDLKTIADSDFTHIAEIDGDPVAFSIALPDLNQALKHINGKLFPFGLLKLLYYSRKIRQIRTALMGVAPKFQGKGIDALLHKRTIENGLAKGFYSAELSWVLESNVDMIRVAERIGASVEKRYRMYSKAFGESERR